MIPRIIHRKTGAKLLKLMLFLLISLALFSQAQAAFREVYINGLKADKGTIIAGRTLQLALRIINEEEMPFIDGYLVVDLVDLTNGENVIKEEIYRGINLRAGEEDTYTYSLEIPEHAEPGAYRIDVYLKDPRTEAVGVPYSFQAPRSFPVTLENDGAYAAVSLDRDKTTFCGHLVIFGEDRCAPHQYGPVVDAGKEQEAAIAISNHGEKIQDLQAKISFYVWDDTAGEQYLSKSFTKDIGPLEAGSALVVPIQYLPPEHPGVYAVRIELVDGNNLYSLYRNRIIVKGLSARITYLVPDAYYYKDKDTASVIAAFVTGADGEHTLQGGSITLQLLDPSGKDAVPPVTTPVNVEEEFQQLFALHPPSLSEFTLRFTVADSQGITLDRYEVKVGPEKFSSKPSALYVTMGKKDYVGVTDDPDNNQKISLSQYDASETMYFQTKVVDEFGKEIPQKVRLYIASPDLRIGPLTIDKERKLDVSLDPGDYTFIFKAGNIATKREVKLFAKAMPEKPEQIQSPKNPPASTHPGLFQRIFMFIKKIINKII